MFATLYSMCCKFVVWVFNMALVLGRHAVLIGISLGRAFIGWVQSKFSQY